MTSNHSTDRTCNRTSDTLLPAGDCHGGEDRPGAALTHGPMPALVRRLEEAVANRPGPGVLGVARVTRKGVQVETGQIVGHWVPMTSAVRALHVDVVARDLERVSDGGPNVHRV